MKWRAHLSYKAVPAARAGHIPEGWKYLRLKNVLATKITDGPHLTPTFLGEGVPFLSVDSIQDGQLSFEDCRYISDEDHREFQKKAAPRRDDILLGKAASTGKIARVKVDIPFSIWSPLALIRVDTRLAAPAYIEYALKSPEVQAQIEDYCTSNTQKNISMDDIPRLFFCCPPLREQVDIANFLDRETAKLDSLTAQQERLMELYWERVSALVLSAFHARETSWMRLGYAATLSQRPVQQQPGETYVPLGLYNRGRGLFHKEPRQMNDMGDSDFFWVEQGDLLISGQFAWEGAVALADRSEAGCVISHRYAALRGNDGVARTEYLFALFLTGFGSFLLNENSRGAAGRNRPLNVDDLLKEEVPIANEKLQLDVTLLIQEGRKLSRAIAAQRDLIAEHRSALISAAVTGKIDVRDEAVTAPGEQMATA